MGSPDSEAGRDDDEGPQRKVTIARPFAVGKFEVTFAEWDACVARAAASTDPTMQGWGTGPSAGDQRVLGRCQGVSPPGCRARPARPTGCSSEAEWEYAARAGTTTRYAFGDTISKSQAQFSEGKRGSAGKTVEVGSFPANRFGLHDMHGNVWEWVEDNWHPDYQGAPIDGSVWLGGDAYRVMRGGSRINFPDDHWAAAEARPPKAAQAAARLTMSITVFLLRPTLRAISR